LPPATSLSSHPRNQCRLGESADASSHSTEISRCPCSRHFWVQVLMGVAKWATSKLTDRRARTHEKSKTPRRRSEAQTAVRCSDLVGVSAINLRKTKHEEYRPQEQEHRGNNRNWNDSAGGLNTQDAAEQCIGMRLGVGARSWIHEAVEQTVNGN